MKDGMPDGRTDDMTEDRYGRLIQDVLDGVATPEEAAELRDHLSRSEAARTRQTELRDVFEALARLELVEAPADLGRRVVSELAAEPRRGGWQEALKAAFERRPMLRFAYPVFAGIVVGAVGTALLLGGQRLPSRGELPVSGTMVGPTGTSPREPVDHSAFTVGKAAVSLQTGRHVGSTWLRIETISDGVTEIEVGLVAPDGEDAPIDVTVRSGATVIERRLRTGTGAND